MSEEFSSFVKWIVIGFVIISVYNLMIGRQPRNDSYTRNTPRTYRTTVILDSQQATTFYNW